VPAAARAADDPASPTTPQVQATTAPTTPQVLPTTAPTDPSTEHWLLADRLSARLNGVWLKNRAVYGGSGNISIRMNAMLLELHAMAALSGHTGAARKDDRVTPLVQFFTTAPVVVRRTLRHRSTGVFPHTPAFEAVFTRSSSHAVLHPSADAIVARALLAAWRVRDIVGMPIEDQQRLAKVIHDVARGRFYRTGQRAENQINWNADVAEANFEINGDGGSLRAYRSQLIWFADHIVETFAKGGATNLSPGGAFRYAPQYPANYGANQFETVEYANLVHGALGFYGRAVKGGMPPLGATRLSRLRRWSNHIVYGTWTHAGYPNWDSGLSTRRRHIRQYWGFALDSLMREAEPGGLSGSADQRAYVHRIAENGLALYLRSAWNGLGALPGPTQFGAPNGFPEATNNPIMAPLRFAIIGASLDDRLGDVKAKTPGSMFSDDATVDRLAISTTNYNTAVLRKGPGPEGGLEPTRLFDGLQRPLTLLASDGTQGPAPGLKLSRAGSTLLDTQPGSSHKKLRAPYIRVSGSRVNRSGQFDQLTGSGVVRRGKTSVSVRQLFSRGSITTSYGIHRGRSTTALLRMPVWGRSSTVVPVDGAAANLRRTDDGRLAFQATTQAGATMTIAFTGVPASASIAIVPYRPTARAPSGVRQIQIRFRTGGVTHVARRITVDAPPPGTS
jgi:hypothetical protein